MLCIYMLSFSLVLFSKIVQFAINYCTWRSNQIWLGSRDVGETFYSGGSNFVIDGVLSLKLDEEVRMKVLEEVLISDLTGGSVCCASWWRPAGSLSHFAPLTMEVEMEVNFIMVWGLFYGCCLFVWWAYNTHNQIPMSQWVWWSQTNVFSNFHRMNFTEF